MKGVDKSTRRETINIQQGHLPGTIDHILAVRGFHHETAELHAQYERDVERFAEVHAKPNEQFRIAPGIYRREGRNLSYADRKLIIGTSHRCVNDETLVDRLIRTDADRVSWDDRLSGNSKGKRGSAFQPREIPDTAFTETPLHPFHLVYDLEAHAHVWAHSNSLTEYEYNPGKVDLLVLPDSHRELIEILTQDADVLIEDVVEGKTGGTTILLEGEPGLGKTLLAEVYAEKMQKILYGIQAGQLGTTPESVAEGLREVYANAARWGAVAFIDEADVYVRRRGDDIGHNAIVAAILVTLERQTAITFLASNRVGDIDDAVLSRCIAIVRFGSPSEEAAKEIWRIQSKIIGIDISEETIDGIVKHHTAEGAQRASGRDIRALLKLAYRYNRLRGRPVDTELLVALGSFKGL